ncbi:MAG: hypothetical protein ACLGH8_00150 [Bacteroidia bacterium]
MPDMFFVFIFSVIIIAIVTGILKSLSQTEKTESDAFNTNDSLMDAHQQLFNQHDITVILQEQSSINDLDTLHHHSHHDNNHNAADFHNNADHSHHNSHNDSQTHSHSDF